MKRMVVVVMALVCLVSVVGSTAEVTISFMEVGDAAKQEAFDECYALWQEINPHIKVEYFPLGYTESFDKIKVLYAAGEPFDVSPMYNPRYDSTFAQAGALLPIDEYIAKEGIKEEHFLPGIFSTWDQFHAGRRIALPYGFTGEVLWYNSDLFDTSGLSYPPTSWQAESWTWRDFVEVAKKITHDADGDGIPDVWGLANIPSASLMPFLWGQEIFNKDFSEFILPSQVGADAIQQAADLALVHGVAPKPGAAPGGLFAGGQGGMTFIGAWTMGEARSWNIVWNWGVQPKGTQRATIMYIDHLYVAKGDSAQEAWEWAKFLTTNPQAQLIYAGKGNGKIPALTRAAQQWVNRELAQLYPGISFNVLVDALPFDIGGRTGEAFPNWTRVSPTLSSAFNRIYAGEGPAYQVLNEIKTSVDAILRER